MSGLENEFLTSIIDNSALGNYIHFVKVTLLFDPVNMLTWKAMVDYYTKHAKSPPRAYIARVCPNFEFMPSDIATGELLALVVRDFTKNRVEELVETHLTNLEEVDFEDPLELLSRIKLAITKIAGNIVSPEQVIKEGEDVSDVMRRYRGELDTASNVALPWPWEPLQRVTNGAKPGSYNVIMARGGNMKTTMLALVVVFWAYYFGRKVLLLTKEMTREELWDLIACILAKIDITKLYDKTLTSEEEETIEDVCRILKEQGNIFIEKPRPAHGEAAVEEVARLVAFHEMSEGDVLAIDGLYFYSNQEVFEMRRFSNKLKDYLLNTKLIGMFTNQGNQNFELDIQADPGKMSNLGDAVSHDANLIIGQELDSEEQELSMAMMKVRRGVRAQWVIHAQPCTNFDVKFSEHPQLDRAVKIPKSKEMSIDNLGRMLGRPVVPGSK